MKSEVDINVINDELRVVTKKSTLIFPFRIKNSYEFKAREICLTICTVARIKNIPWKGSNIKRIHYLSLDEFLSLPEKAKVVLSITDPVEAGNEQKIRRGDVLRSHRSKTEIAGLLAQLRTLGQFKVEVPTDLTLEMNMFVGLPRKLDF